MQRDKKCTRKDFFRWENVDDLTVGQVLHAKTGQVVNFGENQQNIIVIYVHFSWPYNIGRSVINTFTWSKK